jgi:ATP-dependent DNA helicase RecG
VTVTLDDPVTALDGVGPAAARRLADGLDIRTVGDLLAHYPRRYQDAGEVLDLAEVIEGEPATLIGEVLDWRTWRTTPRRGRRGLDVAQGQVRQASGRTFSVTFFNQRWRAQQLAPGTVAAFSGTVGRFRDQLQLKAPDVQVLGRVREGVDAGDAAQRLRHQRLLAIYPASAELPSMRIAEHVEQALGSLPPLEDWLPPSIREEHGLVELDRAVRDIHRPGDLDARDRARRRLVFDELITLQIGVQWRRARLEADAVGLDNTPRDDGHAAALLEALPFPPTAAQRHAFDEIGTDLAAVRPMHRLLQGDVGAGKTLVAVWTMLAALDRGRQAALMVPTEVLAEQHHRTVTDLLAPLGVNVLDGIRVAMLTSSVPSSRRRRILAELLSGELDLVIGTHALLEEGVRFADLGVVVVDEQHRFGVSQRVQLRQKGAENAVLPDVLVMTATPIPRSLAMTLYGDLDVTVIDELPPGRQPVSTQLITPAEAPRRDALYRFVREEIAAGRRAYVVCPLVEESDAVPGRGAVQEHRRLAREVFADVEVELVHGQMRAEDKERAMARFRAGDAQVLVATTVIEVGVDVPEATVMIVEDAERFGISQLHQLRGRVGRGPDRAYCVLFAGWSAELGEDSAERLTAVAATTDGFVLAEADLDLRGAGQLFGRRQSGAVDLRLTDLRRDLEAIATTRALARRIVAEDPQLASESSATLRAEVERRYAGGIAAFEALETG